MRGTRAGVSPSKVGAICDSGLPYEALVPEAERYWPIAIPE